MARSVRSGLVVFALLLGAGCDTDRPLQVGTQNVTVEIIPNAAAVEHFKVWDVTEDSDGIPGPDDVNDDGVPDVSLWCEFDDDAFDQLGSVAEVGSVPWTYAVKLRVIRAGETAPTNLTTGAAAGFNFNRGSYDIDEPQHSDQHSDIPVSHVRGACSGNQDILCNPNSASTICQANGAGSCLIDFGCSGDPATSCDPANTGETCRDRGAGFCTVDGFCSGDPGILCEPACSDLQLGECGAVEVTRIFRFENANRRRLSAANRELLHTGSNAIYDACIGDVACTADVDSGVGAVAPELGLCPSPNGADLGEPGMDPGNPADLNGDPVIFGLQLDKGDRLIVEARRSDDVPANNQTITFYESPGIRAVVTLDGSNLLADEIQCADAPCSLASEEGDPSPNLAFSFTTK